MTAEAGIYLPLGTDGYELCHPVFEPDFERINAEVNGTPRQTTWKPIPVKMINRDEGKNFVRSDSPWLGAHALIFRASAVVSMGSTLRKFGELLRLSSSEADVWLYNPNRVDALDEGASTLLRFADGKVMQIQQHVFKAETVRDVELFKIPNLKVSPTFVDHRFVDRWKKSGLQGLEFKQVWDSPV